MQVLEGISQGQDFLKSPLKKFKIRESTSLFFLFLGECFFVSTGNKDTVLQRALKKQILPQYIIVNVATQGTSIYMQCQNTDKYKVPQTLLLYTAIVFRCTEQVWTLFHISSHSLYSVDAILLKLNCTQAETRDDICKLLRTPGIDSASLCSLAGRCDNLTRTRFLAPMDCSKITALDTAVPPPPPSVAILQYFFVYGPLSLILQCQAAFLTQ